MLGQPGPRGPIEGTQRNSDPIQMRWIEKQRRTANPTKPAAHLGRAVIPGDAIRARDLYACLCDIDPRFVMPRHFATHAAMTRDAVRQIPTDRDLDGATQARGVMLDHG